MFKYVVGNILDTECKYIMNMLIMEQKIFISLMSYY